MLSIIPLPVVVRLGDAAPFQLPEHLPLLDPAPELRPLADQFIANVAAECSLEVTITSEPAHIAPGIRLDLVASDHDLLGLPATSGKRADAGDPDGERYALDIDAGSILVRAATPEGIFRGLTTLRQIIVTSGSREIPAVTIRDTPRFAWRGFSFDICRTFFDAGDIKRIIDVLALYKFNVLHLHLTDSEGWRIDIPAWPRLTEIGSDTGAYGRPGGFLTQEHYRDLVRYAAARFITIVPEIDMPGHTGAIFRAYPELAGDGTSTPDTSGQPAMLQYLHPGHPQVLPFVTDVLSDIAALTPGACLHIGGDEAWGMPDELYATFMNAVRPIVGNLGKKVVAWQEASRAGLSEGDIAQFWLQFDPSQLEQLTTSGIPEDLELPDGTRLTPEMMQGMASMLEKANGDPGRISHSGADVLMSISSRNYLDTPYAEPPADPAQQPEWDRLGMPFYPKTTLEAFYDWDPATVHEALPEERIAGVEAAIWCETVGNFDDLCFLLLPRLAGSGERGWSPRGTNDWNGYRQRLAAQPVFWNAQNLNYFKSSLVDWKR